MAIDWLNPNEKSVDLSHMILKFEVLENAAETEELHMKKFFADQSGATAIEYGLIASAMAAMLIAAMPSISSNVITSYTAIGLRIANAK